MKKHKESQFIGRPVRIPKALRDELEVAIQAHLTAVEKLTEVLNKADGDRDLEPSLGSQDPMWNSYNYELWATGSGDEREGDEHDGREPDVDNEPSLAHTNDLDQDRAQKHLGSINLPSLGILVQCDCDLEQEHDGREPSLGATNPDPDRSQAGWGNYGSEDHYIESPAPVMP